MSIKISELDHIVLNVSDIHRSLDFYMRVLGLGGARVEEFTAGTVGCRSGRIKLRPIIDLFPAKRVTPASGKKYNGNLNHFCLVVTADDFPGVIDCLRENQIALR